MKERAIGFPRDRANTRLRGRPGDARERPFYIIHRRNTNWARLTSNSINLLQFRRRVQFTCDKRSPTRDRRTAYAIRRIAGRDCAKLDKSARGKSFRLSPSITRFTDGDVVVVSRRSRRILSQLASRKRARV